MRRSPRTAIAIGIIVLWLGGLGWLTVREHNKPFAEKLAEAAQLLAPITYYYQVELNGQQVGVASSAIDTVGPRISSIDFIRTILDTSELAIRTTASLTRGFALQSFHVQANGTPFTTLDEKLPEKSPVLLPALLPIALMLTGDPEIGISQDFQVFDLFKKKTQDVTASIRAESLFTVVDSAMYDSIAERWIPAHTDTVRAWKIETTENNVTAWVDAQGRVVEAVSEGGLHLTRTAYEIAFRNMRRNNIRPDIMPGMRPDMMPGPFMRMRHPRR